MRCPRGTLRSPCTSTAELETLQPARGAPLLQDAEELDRAAAVEAVLAAALSRLAFVVVVARRAVLEELLGEHREPDDGVDPLLLGLFRDLDRPHVVVDGVLDDVGDVLALLVQHVRIVHREAGLLRPHDEAVREAAAVHAVQRRDAVRPLLGQAQPVAPVQLVAGAARVVRPDFEAGGVDQAVELVLHAVDDDALRRDPLDAFALRVDQRDVGPVERVEILVVEARALAELPVVGLERLGRLPVADDRVDAGADLLHLLEVRQLHASWRCRRARRRRPRPSAP